METGVELLTSTRKDWAGSVLGGHINWHLALYYLGEPTPRVVTGSPQTLPHGRLNYPVRIIYDFRTFLRRARVDQCMPRRRARVLCELVHKTKSRNGGVPGLHGSAGDLRQREGSAALQ